MPLAQRSPDKHHAFAESRVLRAIDTLGAMPRTELIARSLGLEARLTLDTQREALNRLLASGVLRETIGKRKGNPCLTISRA